MAVLLIAEVTDGHLAVDATAKALTAARKLGEVTVLACGARASDAARGGGEARRRGQGACAPRIRSTATGWRSRRRR